ncbi:FAD-dependent oxidoreductase [Streptomyces sp. MA15]|uniref:FAD-dependent oxidoreductase n=1 Tax=Streptomyces sp. MA15 TaxID=3055061 RepID=UPI0025B11742|nr:FAD-dependent oxidoreductase [Streptomyces sp. MA15]MDN3267122.1 FAD-dependent oxidoreductase [Streptomyces sp. MA15]
MTHRLCGNHSPAADRPGRDRRAVRISVATNSLPPTWRTGPPPRIAVVGGGIAGVTAAVALAERGMAVDLFEQRSHLGGRLAGWPTALRDGSTATMSRGFHAFFRQYYNLRALLRRIDPGLDLLTPVADYPLLHGAGHTDTFAGLPRTPPWNAAAFMMRSPTFRAADLRRIDGRAALELFDVSVPEVYHRLDHLDARSFLEQVRFPASAHHLAFEVFSRSFFADPAELSAAELAVMFHIYFLGSSEGLLFDVPRRTFPAAVWDPLHHHLRRLGATVHTGTAVSAVLPGRQRRFTVMTRAGAATGEHAVDAVVLAADTRGLQRIVETSPALGGREWRRRITCLRSAPPFLVSRLWLDRPLNTDRPAFLGTGGFGPLDNISVLDRYEDEARAWARRSGGCVVELHAYALPDVTDLRRVRERLTREMRRIYPETANATVVDERHELHADCPLFPSGGFGDRPTVTTPDPCLVLAGDLVRVDLPVALMERAATSGFQAANALLARWGVRGHDLWSVPGGGRMALLRVMRALSARQRRTVKRRVPDAAMP